MENNVTSPHQGILYLGVVNRAKSRLGCCVEFLGTKFLCVWGSVCGNGLKNTKIGSMSWYGWRLACWGWHQFLGKLCSWISRWFSRTWLFWLLMAIPLLDINIKKSTMKNQACIHLLDRSNIRWDPSMEYLHAISSWWFQPLWKIWSSNWKSSPTFGVNIKNLWVTTS